MYGGYYQSPKDYLEFLPAEIICSPHLDFLYVASPYDEFEIQMNYKSEIHDCPFKIIF